MGVWCVNKATQARITSGTDQSNLTGGNATWQTPPAIYQELNEAFCFDIDLFADDERALASVWFGPGSDYEHDALAADWHLYGRTGFSNPPYGRFLRDVLAKAADEAQLGFQSVHLIPMRMTVPVRQALFRSGRVSDWLIPDRRITFYENGAPRLDARGTPMPALFDSTILVFSPGTYFSAPVVREWKVPSHI